MVTCNPEAAMIGCVIIDPKTYDTVRAEVAEDQLYFDESKAVLNACGEVLKESMLDLSTLIPHLTPELKTFAVKCVDMVTSTTLLQSYIDAVKLEDKKRKSSVLVGEMQGDALYGDMDALAVKSDELNKLLTASSNTDEMSAWGAYTSFISEKQMGTREYIKTGYSRLDAKTYIDKGDYIIVGGRPSSGKTAFAINLMLNMAKDYRTVFFSLETKNEKIRDRALTAYAGLNFGRVKTSTLTQDENKRVIGGETFTKLPITFVNAAGRAVPWIQAKALKLKAQIIFIDYLGLISSEGQKRYEKVTNISIALHTMAQQTGITVFALSQLSREGKGVPTMEDLRESGQIEQDADIIMLVNPKEEDRREIIVAKNKEGETGIVPFSFDGSQQKFLQLEMRYDDRRPPKDYDD